MPGHDGASSVPEVPHAGQHHGDAGVVGGLDHFVVADRSAGLDHRGGAGFDRDQKAGMAVLVLFFVAGLALLRRVRE